jgi:hypothetical protein
MSMQVVDLLSNDSTDSAIPGAGTQQPAELSDWTSEPVEVPNDPVLLRLLPDAYRDDGEAAAEFRRLTDGDLRAAKRAGLSRIVTDLGNAATQRGGGVRIDLDEDGVSAWLPPLTDLRLTLGTRIGVTEDAEERDNIPVGSARYAELATYDWLSWFQDALVRAVIGD